MTRRHRGICARGLGILVSGAVVIAMGGGCAPKTQFVSFAPTSRDYQSDDYPEVYERWTRHQTIIHEVESALEVWVTYKSRDFREAFVAHYGELYTLSEGDRTRLLESQREAAGAAYEFLVTAQSANYRWNDLEKKNSPWRVSLLDGLAQELIPEEIKLERLPDIFEREFFPAKTPFTKTYLVRFPRAGNKDDSFAGERSGRLMLRIAGPMGRAELMWVAR